MNHNLSNKENGYLTMSMAWNMTSDLSTPITWEAPALAANMERMAVPQPTSRTLLFRNISGFFSMAS